jgi:hypothetical protein
MADQVTRRNFFKKAATVTAATAAVYSWEEYDLLAYQAQQGQPPAARGQGGPGGPGMGGEEGAPAPRGRAAPIPDIPGPMPMGKLGSYEVSRLIAGHNLVVGQAHSRDLLWTSGLLQAYFTESKILETFAMYEAKGVNTSFARMSAQMVNAAKKYMKERGGKLQWIAACSMSEKDMTSNMDMGLDLGSKIAYVHGNSADGLFRNKRIDIIAKGIELLRKNGMVAGVCCHLIDVPMALEKEGIKPDFYVKTFNAGNYWSAGPPLEPDPNWKPTETQLAQPERGAFGNHNNLWDTTPKQTQAFMATVKVPWIAFKVNGAGAIHPRDSFKFCFEGGADFVVPGMYDFQVAENANVTKQLFQDKSKINRTRPWLA